MCCKGQGWPWPWWHDDSYDSYITPEQPSPMYTVTPPPSQLMKQSVSSDSEPLTSTAVIVLPVTSQHKRGVHLFRIIPSQKPSLNSRSFFHTVIMDKVNFWSKIDYTIFPSVHCIKRHKQFSIIFNVIIEHPHEGWEFSSFCPLPFTRNYWKQIHCKTNFRQTTFILYIYYLLLTGMPRIGKWDVC